MATAAQSPNFTLKIVPLPSSFHRRIIVAGIVEYEISCTVGSAAASKDLDRRKAADQLRKARYKLS